MRERRSVVRLFHREWRLLAAHAVPARGDRLATWATVARSRLRALPATVVLSSHVLVVASRTIYWLVFAAVDPARELRGEWLFSVHRVMRLLRLQRLDRLYLLILEQR